MTNSSTPTNLTDDVNATSDPNEPAAYAEPEDDETTGEESDAPEDAVPTAQTGTLYRHPDNSIRHYPPSGEFKSTDVPPNPGVVQNPTIGALERMQNAIRLVCNSCRTVFMVHASEWDGDQFFCTHNPKCIDAKQGYLRDQQALQTAQNDPNRAPEDNSDIALPSDPERDPETGGPITGPLTDPDGEAHGEGGLTPVPAASAGQAFDLKSVANNPSTQTPTEPATNDAVGRIEADDVGNDDGSNSNTTSQGIGQAPPSESQVDNDGE